MGFRIGVMKENENDLAWKFAKVLMGGSVFAALLWWNPIPIDMLLQIVCVLVLPLLIVTAFIGLTSWDFTTSTWNELASGGFSKRVEKHLRSMRTQFEEQATQV